MDLDIAEPSANAPSGRRRLIGSAGLAALAGAAAALVAEATAGAAPGTPTDADKELLGQVIGLELAARDLYRARLDVGAGDITDLVFVMAENHRAYAEAIAGATGISANPRNEAVYQANVDDFQSGRVRFATSAHALEQTAVATHTSLLGRYESSDALRLTSSILVIEARHATVLADLLGIDDLDVLFGNEQDPLSLRGGAA